MLAVIVQNTVFYFSDVYRDEKGIVYLTQVKLFTTKRQKFDLQTKTLSHSPSFIRESLETHKI